MEGLCRPKKDGDSEDLDLCYYLGNIAALGSTHSPKRTRGRHEKGGINSVPGDASNHSIKMVVGAFLLLEKIEIVAADFIAGSGSTGYIKTLDPEAVLGQKTLLDFSGQSQGLLLFGQVRDEGHVADDITLITP